ncbi:hypothetical protein [Acinetobacter sp. ANC 3813]|uniref:hypothetical protein n=1 Tax=Acinetobacter sp. ANC 3813 TaxID=1977873 RepID=UPI000A34A286|nr:hypothetical protein [Acinetobacter sp. ANC 3813]OTG87921.1 hypothetical protein B9T34_16440 [Acinetobacter sp. ANC 3813]
MNKDISINQFCNFMGFQITPDQHKTFKSVYQGAGEINIGYSAEKREDTAALIAVWNLLMREDSATVVVLPHGNRLDLVIFKKVQQYIEEIANGPLKSLVKDIQYDYMNTFNRGVSRLVFLDDCAVIPSPEKMAGFNLSNLIIIALDADNLAAESIQLVRTMLTQERYRIILATPYLDDVDWSKAPESAFHWERFPNGKCVWHCRTELSGTFTRKAPDFHVEYRSIWRNKEHAPC